MPYQTVAAVLSSDTVDDRTSAQVFSMASPEQQAQWSTAAGVPYYLYKCLLNIFLPAGSTADDLQKSITAVYGLGNVVAPRSIQISTLPSEVSDKRESGMDKTGAELSLVKVLSEIHPDVTDVDAQTLKQTDLRIRYLLDILWRSQRAKADRLLHVSPLTTPALPTSDSSMDPRYPFKCQWKGWLANDSAMVKASLYWAEYTRNIVPGLV